jgi:ferredoxin
MEDKNKLVSIEVDGQQITCTSSGQTLLNAIMNAGLLVRTACGGKGACHLCRVTVVAGAEHIAPPQAWEEKALGNVLIAQGIRLSCQVSPAEGMKITLPPYETPEQRRERIKNARQRKKP